MINSEMIQGKWNEIRGKVKERWGKLTDDDLQIFGGNVDQVIGKIQQRTGVARDEIEQFLDKSAKGLGKTTESAGEGNSGMASSVVETVQKGYEQTAETLKNGYQAAAGTLEEGQHQVEEFVQERPAQSLLIAFGVGLAAGAGVALLVSQRSNTCTPARAFDNMSRQFMDSLAAILPENVARHVRG